jgi:hypothetical protein
MFANNGHATDIVVEIGEECAEDEQNTKELSHRTEKAQIYYY